MLTIMLLEKPIEKFTGSRYKMNSICHISSAVLVIFANKLTNSIKQWFIAIKNRFEIYFVSRFIYAAQFNMHRWDSAARLLYKIYTAMCTPQWNQAKFNTDAHGDKRLFEYVIL